MMDKCVQVFVKAKEKSKRSVDSQTDWLYAVRTHEASTQRGGEKKSYKRSSTSLEDDKWTYDKLKEEVLCS